MSTGSAIKGYRRGRKIRSAVTLLVLVGILAGAAWFGWQEVLGESEPATRLECTVPEPGTTQKVTTSDVELNVYNAGETPGLADQTSRELEARGFGVDLVANAPSEWADVARVRIIGRAEDAPEVQMLAAHLDEPRIDVDDRGEAKIDLVLGDKFEGMLDEAPNALDVESTVPICTEVPTED